MTSYAEQIFKDKHPAANRTIFLMMSLSNQPVRRAIRDAIEEVASELQFGVVRADDYDYTGELWSNVRLCMDNCGIGIAVFDGTQTKNAEVNIALELGYMFALKRKCLILREVSMDMPVAMLAHRIHTPYDMLDIEGTLRVAVRKWLSDNS